MKKLSKIISLSLAFMLSLATAMPTASVGADPIYPHNGSITITSYKVDNYKTDGEQDPEASLKKGSLEGRTFVAYRILDGIYHDDTHVGYTIPTQMQEFYQKWDWDNTITTTISTVAKSDMLRIADADDVSTTQSAAVQSNDTISGIDIMKAIASLDSQVKFVGPVESSESGIMPIAALGSDITGDKLNEAVLEYLNGMKDPEYNDKLYAFANSAFIYAANNGLEKFTATLSEDGSEATFTNLPYGYYVVGEEEGGKPGNAISTALLTAVHTANSVEIVSKDVAPTVNKFITDDADDKTLEKTKVENSAAIGDTVNFKIVANLPDVQGYNTYTYTVVDTFDPGLTNNGDAKVYYYANTGAAAQEITNATFKDNSIVTIENDDNTLTIKFSSDWILANGINSITNIHTHDDVTSTDDPTIDIPYVVITYSARVNDTAEIGREGNENKAVITYSNDPSHSTITDNKTADTPESKTITYVYGVELYKTALQEEGGELKNLPLPGAIFRLINKNVDDTTNYNKYATLDLDSDTHTYKLTGWNDVGTQIISTDDPDHVSIIGLDAGNYEFVEDDAPTGYETVRDPIAFTIDASSSPSNPNFLENDGDSTLVTVDKSETNGVGKVTVQNIIDGYLPGTGGVGRVMVYVLGSILVLGAAVLFVLKKRSSKNA